jgi:hypothetical protein
MNTMVVEVFRGKKPGQWYFHVLWKNGRVAVVSESYHEFNAAFRLATKFYEAMIPGTRLAVPDTHAASLKRYSARLDKRG